MALSSTVYTFTVDLADVDRGVYADLSFKVARHPSETEDHFAARVLAYGLEYTDELRFSAGLSDPDEPSLAVRDLTGALLAWIDVGTPDAARLHAASKAAPRVAVYTHKSPGLWLRALGGARIHAAERLELYALDRALVAWLAAKLDRRMAFALYITDRRLYVTVGAETADGPVERLSLDA